MGRASPSSSADFSAAICGPSIPYCPSSCTSFSFLYTPTSPSQRHRLVPGHRICAEADRVATVGLRVREGHAGDTGREGRDVRDPFAVCTCTLRSPLATLTVRVASKVPNPWCRAAPVHRLAQRSLAAAGKAPSGASVSKSSRNTRLATRATSFGATGRFVNRGQRRRGRRGAGVVPPSSGAGWYPAGRRGIVPAPRPARECSSSRGHASADRA